jgi:hypothetical protein
MIHPRERRNISRAQTERDLIVQRETARAGRQMLKIKRCEIESATVMAILTLATAARSTHGRLPYASYRGLTSLSLGRRGA